MLEPIDSHLLWYNIEGTDQQASTSSSNEVSPELDTHLSVLTAGSCGDLNCIGTVGQLCGWFDELSKGYYIVVSSSGTSSSGRFVLALDDTTVQWLIIPFRFMLVPPETFRSSLMPLRRVWRTNCISSYVV